MIAGTRARRQAEVFAALVDGDPVGREPSSEFAVFLEIVAELRDRDAPVMRPEFASDLRERLLLEAPRQLAVAAQSRPGDSGRREDTPVPSRAFARLTRVAAVTCLVIGVSGGVAAASQSALPGDPLYGVKRAIERAEVRLAGSDSSRGQELVEQARTRLDEVSDLAITRPPSGDTTRLIQETLASFTAQADDGADSLLSSYDAGSDPVDIAALREFTGQTSTDIESLTAVVPAEAGQQLIDAAELVDGLDETARDTCQSCSSRTPVDLSPVIRDLADAAESIADLPGLLPADRGGGQPGDDGTDSGPRTDLPTTAAPPGADPSPQQGGDSGDKPGSSKPGGGNDTGGGDTGGDTGGGNGGNNGGGNGGATTPAPILPLPDLPLPTLGILGL